MHVNKRDLPEDLPPIITFRFRLKCIGLGLMVLSEHRKRTESITK